MIDAYDSALAAVDDGGFVVLFPAVVDSEHPMVVAWVSPLGRMDHAHLAVDECAHVRAVYAIIALHAARVTACRDGRVEVQG